MPRPATIQRDDVRDALLREGRNLVINKGLKGANIQELTSLVGIAQGSFYSLFGSKEELFFEILEQEEVRITGEFMEKVKAEELTRTHLKTVIAWSLNELRDNPVLRTVLDPSEYKKLLRKIPEERFRRHMQDERNMLARVLTGFQSEGLIAAIDPGELAGLYHALFVVSLHRGEIGEEVFSNVFDRLIGLVADHVATQGEKTTHP